tara:strand:+ start:20814 stop:21563 length:750 start_codon:yes stop_codon:yes gene_type:complete
LTIQKLNKNNHLPTTTVIDYENKTDDLRIIWLKKPANFDFTPGQYCTIGKNKIERAYSIASSPHEEFLELFIELVPENDGGVLTPQLWNLKTGDLVTIRPRAKGIFTLKENHPNQLFVGTVTGIVPYVSIIRNYIHQNKIGHKFYILEGASYFDEFVYDNEFFKLMKSHPELLHFVPTISRPDDIKNSYWNGITGRVNNIIVDQINSLNLSPSNTMVYACGHPGMIEDVKTKVSNLSFEFLEERFWKDD